MQSTALFRLADVATVDQLARALGVPLQVFQEVISCEDPSLLYFMHRIPKRNPRSAGDFRVVWESLSEIVARSHKAVARRLDDFARRQEVGYPNTAVHGYVRGGSTRSNAEPHCGARVLVRADIEEFFPSITLARVEQTLRVIGLRSGPALELARFVTIDGALPLGLPESPVISNLVCIGLDEDLQSLANKQAVKYTRYADDITFSGNENLPSREQIRIILDRHGFRLSERKFKKSKRGQAHFVTGLSVSEKDYPHVPRRLKRILRMELHFCESFGLEAHATKNEEDPRKTYLRLEGTVKYVAFIERRKAHDLTAQWKRIVRQYHGPTRYAQITNESHGERFLVGDETEFNVDGVRYLAMCFVRVADMEKVENAIQLLLGDYLTKPGAKGNLGALQTVGIHYTDAHFDLRTHTLDLMTDYLSWSASVEFARLDSTKHYREAYLRLFTSLVRQEILTADEMNLEFLVERNSKVKLTLIRQIVEAEYRVSEVNGGRRPRSQPLICHIEKGKTPSLTLPDFVLAAFRSYAARVQDERVLDFERIRDRVRYVHDADTDTYYTRKKPFMGLGVH